jgi:pyrroline-5-carboxylate reductase
MGGALLKGWLAQGIAPNHLFLQEPTVTPDIADLAAKGIVVGNPPTLSAPPTVILLAVKPQIIDDVLVSAASLAGPDTVLLSIAAGRTISSLAKHFPLETAIVRAMPNTPAAIGRGVTALCANAAVKPEQTKLCEALLKAAGETVWLEDESQMDAVTAVSGSGPAYVFLLTECLAEAGKALGLPPELADQLARATVSGAGELMRLSDETPADLRQAVTSPQGTTAAALDVLMAAGKNASAHGGALGTLMRRTVEAAAQRSRELAN